MTEFTSKHKTFQMEDAFHQDDGLEGHICENGSVEVKCMIEDGEFLVFNRSAAQAFATFILENTPND